jgi:carnitine O-acetyltransferase
MARRALSSQKGQSSAPLYASQRSLPHLPVPTLSSTLSKYSETLKPLLTPAELKQSVSKIQAFEQSELATKLQNRLEARAKDKESWLSEWWNETAYMGYRGRIVPNVSYFYLHKQGLGGGKSQEERAAELVRGVVEFRKLVTRYVVYAEQ